MTATPGSASPAPQGAGGRPVLILHNKAAIYLPRLRERFPAIDWVECPLYADFTAALQRLQPEIVITFKPEKGKPFPGPAMFATPSLRWVHVGGAGIDHIGRWDPAQVTVTNSSGVHGRLMADYVTTTAQMLAMGFSRFAAHQAKGEWRSGNVRSVLGAHMTILGFGRVGAAIGAMARQLGMRVTGVRNRPAPSDGADRVVGLDALSGLLGETDFLVLALPMTEATRGLVDDTMLGRLKPGAFLVNVARGGILDEAALIRRLASGHLGGAALDVFATEPLPPDSPLWTTPNLIVTPHIAGNPQGWEMQVAELFGDNLERWLAGRPLQNLVDPIKGY